MKAKKRAPRVIVAEEGEILDIELEEDLLKKNDELARENRRTLDEHGIKTIDIMGAIGSGKTSLIEALADRLKSRYRLGMIAGDVTTTIDADRVERHGVLSVQVNTGKECHLDANLIQKALKQLNLDAVDVLFIENVGNLICPAEFKLGAHMRIVVVSVTEGEYMVIKHPLIFLSANVVVLNKIDFAEAMSVDPSKLAEQAKEINPKLKVVKTSVKTGEGITDLIKALEL
jgi:hydrogenase nickel incorporation protein HypB